MFKQLLILLLSVFFVGCLGKNGNMKIGDENVSQLKFKLSDKIKKQSELFEIEDIVRLAANDSSLIGDISTLIRRPSGFYILDARVGKRIVKFDTHGNFLYAIDRRGRGPGEYLKMNGISVDPSDKYLYLYDAELKRVSCFDANNGKYIRYFPVKFSAYSFSVLPMNEHFIFYCSFIPNKHLKKAEGLPNFIVTDTLGNVKKTFAYFNEKINFQNVITTGDVFTYNGSDFCCFYQYQDVIFKITQNLEMPAAYHLNFLNDNQVKNDALIRRILSYENVDFKRNAIDRRNSGIYELRKINFTERFISFIGSVHGKMFSYLYDNKLSEVIDVGALTKDVVGHNLYFADTDDKSCYVFFLVSVLKKVVSSTPENYHDKIVNIVQELNDEDNPVIVKLKLKNI